MRSGGRDERERQVDLRATEIAYVVLSFGVLLAVFWRGLRGEGGMDLLGLVVLSGGVWQAYIAWRRAYSIQLLVVAVAAAIAGAGLAAATVILG